MIYSLLGKYEWLGKFWFINDKENSFPGLLSYTPEKGIKLRALFTDQSPEVVVRFLNAEFDNYIIHGDSIHTGPITLLGVASRGVGHSNFSDIEEEYFCRVAIFGCHFDNSEQTFDVCDFKINNLNEFVFPDLFNLNDQFLKDDELSATYEDISIEIKKKSLRVEGPEKISNLITPNRNDLRNDLDKAVAPLIEKHGHLSVGLIRELSYYLRLKGKDNKSISFRRILELVGQISNLFSFLLLKIIVPLDITLKSGLNEKGYYDNKYSVLISRYLNDKQIDKIMLDKNHRSLPVTVEGIKNDFNGVIREWFHFLREDQNTIYETLFNHIYFRVDPMQHFVLLIAAMSRLSMIERTDTTTIKDPDWFIEKYAPDNIKDLFRSHFPKDKQNDRIGKTLADIRNHIIHPNPTDYWRNKVDAMLVSNLSELIFFVFISALYKTIGVSEESIAMFLSKHQWYIRKYTESFLF